jgi:hypothetical protein
MEKKVIKSLWDLELPCSAKASDDAADQRKTLVKACHASALSTPRFAALHGVKYQTLAAWIHRAQRTTTPHVAQCRPGQFKTYHPVAKSPVWNPVWKRACIAGFKNPKHPISSCEAKDRTHSL